MSQQPLAEYLKNKSIRANLRYLRTPKERGYVLANGVIVSEEMINEMYPITQGKVTLWNYNQKGQNPDKTWVG